MSVPIPESCWVEPGRLLAGEYPDGRTDAEWERGVPVEEAASRVFEGGSYGNGAAMRVAPAGVRFGADPERLADEAARSARVTHAHPEGIAGAVVQASAVGAALRGEDPLAAARAAAGSRRRDSSSPETPTAHLPRHARARSRLAPRHAGATAKRCPA